MEYHIRLIILSSSLNPEQISDQIGKAADETWLLGDQRKDTIILEKENGWMLFSKRKLSAELHEHLDNIRVALNGAECKIKNISETLGCDVQLSCVVYTKSEPPLEFEKKDIAWLASMGASLDIDVYLTENVPESV
jgi:hypothetical protein